MGWQSAVQLVLLAAIWGSSFMFMRVAVDEFGVPLLTELRLLLAAIFLAIVALITKRVLNARQYWRYFLVVGLLNSALPFLLYSYAATQLSVAMMAILNATAPMWGSVVNAVDQKRLPQKSEVFGLLLGISGVVILTSDGAWQASTLGLLAAGFAAFCYALASNYASKRGKAAGAFGNAHGCLWAAAILLMPLQPTNLPDALPSLNSSLAVLALGIVCSGVAYLLYFRLIDQVGATSALSVAYLIPLFGMLWGWWFLGESIGWHTLLGGLVVVSGTMLITGFNPLQWFKQRRRAHG
ncbi:DMT family transporter [Paraferrimonas sedimenticola]|nr:DMT family transporter [Paraferrimonas sedimenticola]